MFISHYCISFTQVVNDQVRICAQVYVLQSPTLNGSGGWGEEKILTLRTLGKEVPLRILVEYVWNNLGEKGESQMLWVWLEKKTGSS